MDEYLLDTNVLSRIYYGDAHLRAFVERLDAAVNAIVYIECIQGSIKKSEKELIKASLDKLRYYPLTPEVSLKAISPIDKYSSSHGLFLADALIAATALVHDLTLVTYNLKDFDYIKGLVVVRP